MLMVRRAILRISCSVGELGNISSKYVVEMTFVWLGHRLIHCSSRESTSARLFFVLVSVSLIDAHLRYLTTMAESTSSIDSSFVLIGTEQSQPLLPSRPPTVTSDTTFPSSISTPTSPLDSNVSFVGTLEVGHHTYLRSTSFRLTQLIF
jgi:hypothetical protein